MSEPFVMVPKSLLRAPSVSPTAKLLLALLADYQNRETGQCNPGIDKLAEELAVSARTIDRSITELSRLGFIRITWRQRTSHYEVAARTRWPEILKRQIGVSGESCNAKMASQLRQIGVSEATVSIYEPDLENQKEAPPIPPAPDGARPNKDARVPISRQGEASENRAASAVTVPQNATAPDLFQEFMGVFLAAGKLLNDRDTERALKLWLNFDAPEHAVILEHLKRSVVDGTWSDARYIPMPASYLTSRAWTRRGPGRILPRPAKSESKVESALRGATDRFRKGER